MHAAIRAGHNEAQAAGRLRLLQVSRFLGSEDLEEAGAAPWEEAEGKALGWEPQRGGGRGRKQRRDRGHLPVVGPGFKPCLAQACRCVTQHHSRHCYTDDGSPRNGEKASSGAEISPTLCKDSFLDPKFSGDGFGCRRGGGRPCSESHS